MPAARVRAALLCPYYPSARRSRDFSSHVRNTSARESSGLTTLDANSLETRRSLVVLFAAAALADETLVFENRMANFRCEYTEV